MDKQIIHSNTHGVKLYRSGYYTADLNGHHNTKTKWR